MKITKLCPREDLGFANTYVVGDEGSPCLIVDPGYNGNDFLSRYVEKHHQGKCLAFLLTHAHYDHIYGLSSYKGVENIPVFCSEKEAEILFDPNLNLGKRLPDIENIGPERVHIYPCEDEDEIKLGGVIIEVVETPFHTKGSCCFYIREDNVCFTGDTLFHMSIGRTDLPTGSSRTVDSSLRKLIKKLNPDTKIYPGHGLGSKLENELRLNPFINLLTR